MLWLGEKPGYRADVAVAVGDGGHVDNARRRGGNQHRLQQPCQGVVAQVVYLQQLRALEEVLYGNLL